MDETAEEGSSQPHDPEDVDALPPTEGELEPGEAPAPQLPDHQIPEPGRTLSAVTIRVGPTADFVDLLVRLREAIDDLELHCGLAVLRRLPRVLREADFKVTAVIVDEELIDVEPGDTSQVRYGVAFDLGTTTVVATLLDLETGTPVAVASMLNKQQPFGGDVISRISATMLDPDALDRLRAAASATLAELTAEVCEEGSVDPALVYEVALAGNATMVALALGIDPEPLGVAPFVMSAASFPSVQAADLGIAVHPRAPAVVYREPAHPTVRCP